MKLTLNPHLSKTNPERCGTQNLLKVLRVLHPPRGARIGQELAFGE
jgi:hypothetical protein